MLSKFLIKMEIFEKSEFRTTIESLTKNLNLDKKLMFWLKMRQNILNSAKGGTITNSGL